MPTLSIEGDDNHFVIKTKTHELKFQSWQVTDAGIQFLRQKGIDIPRVYGDKITFDKPILNRMKELHLVYIKGEQHQSAEDDEGLNAEQRLGLVFREKANRNDWEIAVAALKVPHAWRPMSLSASRYNGALHICDPNTFYNRKQRLLGSWTATDILANKTCKVEPITGRYIVEAHGHWPAGWNVHKWIHNLSGMDADGTLFHDMAHGGRRLASHELIYPGRTYFFVAPIGSVIPKEVTSRALKALSVTSPYPALRKWQAWSITIPHTFHELTYGRLQDWFGRIGYSLGELPWRLALISPPSLYYTSEGIPVLEQGQDAIIEVLSPTDRIQGAESTEIQVKKDNVLYLPHTDKIRSSRFLTFPLHQPGKYLVNGVNGLARPLNFNVVTKKQNDVLVSPSALKVTINLKGNVSQLDAFENGQTVDREHTLEVDPSDETSLPQVQVSCPIPLDLMWTFGKDSEIHWQPSEPTSIKEHIHHVLRLAWEKRDTASLCLDAGAFGKLTLKVVMRKVVIQHRVDKESAVSTASTDHIQKRLQWLLAELAKEKNQGIQTSIPLTIRKRLSRLKNVPECTLLLQQYRLIPLYLLPHLVAMTTVLEQERHFL